VPTITAVIPTYNRTGDIRLCLEHLLRQTRMPDEVIVVDDASADDTAQVVRSFAARFANLRYVRFLTNQGQAFARNTGFATASGDLILSLDDDCRLLEPNGLERAIELLDGSPTVASLALNACVPNGNHWVAPDREPFDVAVFLGGANLTRTAVLRDSGGYAQFFRGGAEEDDLCLRMLNGGHRIVATPQIIVYHAWSEAERDWHRVRFYTHRNSLLLELCRCPARYLPFRFLATWLSHTASHISKREWTIDFKVLAAIPPLLPLMMRERNPVSPGAYRAWRRVRRAQ